MVIESEKVVSLFKGKKEKEAKSEPKSAEALFVEEREKRLKAEEQLRNQEIPFNQHVLYYAAIILAFACALTPLILSMLDGGKL